MSMWRSSKHNEGQYLVIGDQSCILQIESCNQLALVPRKECEPSTSEGSKIKHEELHYTTCKKDMGNNSIRLSDNEDFINLC